MDTESAITPCPRCGAKNRVPAARRGRVRCAACTADLPWLTTADDRTFDAIVTNASLPVLVDLWAPWCGPCRMVSPIVEQLASDFAGRLKVVKVNSDHSPQVSARHRVTSIPTLLMYSGGSEVARQIGALPASQLRQWVQTAIGAN